MECFVGSPILSGQRLKYSLVLLKMSDENSVLLNEIRATVANAVLQVNVRQDTNSKVLVDKLSQIGKLLQQTNEKLDQVVFALKQAAERD